MNNMAENMKCEYCRWFKKSDSVDAGGLGHCLFAPPVIVSNAGGHVSKRPHTHKDFYCSKAEGIFVDPDV